MADDDGILYIDSIKDRTDIVGECVEIVTAAGIIRAPMTAAVERHATPTPLGMANQRDVPPVGAEPPWCHKDYRAAASPVPKVNPGSIARLDHGGPSDARRGGVQRSNGRRSLGREGQTSTPKGEHHRFHRRSSFHAEML